MSETTIAPDFPCKFDMFVHMTDGTQTAVATVTLAPGATPTREKIDHLIADALKQTRAQLGKKWRLCSRHEFVGDLLAERTGSGDWAIPGPDSWSEPSA